MTFPDKARKWALNAEDEIECISSGVARGCGSLVAEHNTLVDALTASQAESERLRNGLLALANKINRRAIDHENSGNEYLREGFRDLAYGEVSVTNEMKLFAEECIALATEGKP